MNTVTVSLAALAVGAIHATGAGPKWQSTGDAPSFEVAAIRIDTSGSYSSHWHDHSGKMFATNITLLNMIQRAYALREYQVSGPAWLKSVRYDIEAEAPASTTTDQYTLMIRNLLAERFKFVFHREQRNLPIYALVAAKSGPKLLVVKDDGHSGSDSRRGHMTVHGPMSTFAEALSRQIDRPVVDKTGLAGYFQGELEWTPDVNQAPASSPSGSAAAASESTGPSIFTAVQEQLGLKLIPQKGAVEILVVDHAERIPTEN